MKIYLVLALASFIFLCNVYPGEIQNRWPIPDWELAHKPYDSMSTPQCIGFLDFSTRSKNFLTDGLVVIKDGLLQYEHYDPNYNAEIPHILWSVSKTITGSLLGIAVRDGKISLDQYLNEFYPRVDAGEEYKRIKIKNLFYLDAGFIWNEYYFGDVKQSPVINMLYGAGHTDMAKYTLSKKNIRQGPDYKFNYSTGTPVITMGVLKKVYGSDYNEMPWKSLFNPIGLRNISFERDQKGVFNGGSSVFATPRDMAKIGYLYLNNGIWNGKEILPAKWIQKTLQVSPGYLSPGTVINNITDDGVFGGSIWLNRAVKKGFGRPYPISPEDMYLSIGHYGQLIIILPTQKMVIARTGYDQEYNSKIDEFVSRSIACFADPNYPIGKNIPPPKSSQVTIGGMLKTLITGIKENIIQPALAKNICSCHYISGVDVKTCIDRSNIPLARELMDVFIKDDEAHSGKYFVYAKPKWNNKTAVASFDTAHPEYGCTLK